MPKNGFFCLNQHRMDVIGNMSSVRHETGAISETVQTIRQTSADSVAYCQSPTLHRRLYSPYRVMLWSKLYR